MAMVADGWMRLSESEMKPMAVTFRYRGLNTGKRRSGQATIRRITRSAVLR
jgi:hypothetical protein